MKVGSVFSISVSVFNQCHKALWHTVSWSRGKYFQALITDDAQGFKTLHVFLFSVESKQLHNKEPRKEKKPVELFSFFFFSGFAF